MITCDVCGRKKAEYKISNDLYSSDGKWVDMYLCYGCIRDGSYDIDKLQKIEEEE
ncbi:MAG: hypothetical protein AB1567_00865 [bacterium]